MCGNKICRLGQEFSEVRRQLDGTCPQRSHHPGLLEHLEGAKQRGDTEDRRVGQLQPLRPSNRGEIGWHEESCGGIVSPPARMSSN